MNLKTITTKLLKKDKSYHNVLEDLKTSIQKNLDWDITQLDWQPFYDFLEIGESLYAYRFMDALKQNRIDGVDTDTIYQLYLDHITFLGNSQPISKTKLSQIIRDEIGYETVPEYVKEHGGTKRVYRKIK